LSQDIKKLFVEILGSRVVAYYPALARRVGGVKAAVMLSQLMYWSNTKDAKERGGWLYKAVEEFEEETGLTGLEQQSARRCLMTAGVIEAKLKGVPRRWWYRVDVDGLTNLIERNSRPMELPLNGVPVVWDDGSMVYRSNIGRFARAPLDGDSVSKPTAFPSALIQEITQDSTPQTTQRIPPADMPGGASDAGQQQQEGLSAGLVEELEKFGIVKKVWRFVSQTMVANGLDDADVMSLIEHLRRTEPERGPALFKSRIEILRHKKSAIGYTNCVRCGKVYHEDFLAPIEGRMVCGSCCTDEEYPVYFNTDEEGN
jgi:hypothetical protein